MCLRIEVVTKVFYPKITNSEDMDGLPRDVVMIVYRYVHNYRYRLVMSEYYLKYVTKWREETQYFMNDMSAKYALASWRICEGGTYQTRYNWDIIYDMLRCTSTDRSNRGGTPGYLPKNY